MKDTTVVMISHHRPVQGTAQCVERVVQGGALVSFSRGHSDVSLGRCAELTRALDDAINHDFNPMKRVFLLVDDDMHFRPTDALELIRHARETGTPSSAVYGNAGGRVCAYKGDGVQWEVGLGLCAVRMDRLLKLAETLGRVRCGMNAKGIHPFACSGLHPSIPERWTSEDFWLSRNLGGFELLPIGAGHYKTYPMFPDEETVRKVVAGDALGTELAAEHHQGYWPDRGAVEAGLDR
jgi:hypothetical protein